MSSQQPPQHFKFTEKVKKSKIPLSPSNKLDKPIKTTNKCGCRRLDLKVHTYCNNGCGCSKNGSQCSSQCVCKGSCYNGRSISDELFFKVWRNIVLRTEITGDRRCRIIVEKNAFKKELTDTLKYYNIQYNEGDINNYTKLFNSNSSRSVVTVSTVLEKYLEIEREKRQQYIHEQYKSRAGPEHSNIFRVSTSEILKKYINTLLPEEQLKLPTVQDIIDEEAYSVSAIKNALKSLYQREGLQFNDSTMVVQFIQSGSINTTPLINSEICQQRMAKKIKVYQTLKEFGITNPKHSAQIEAYANTFKQSEIIANKVWSFDDIINAERKIIYIPIETRKRNSIIQQEIARNNLIYRPKSKCIIKYIRNIPPFKFNSLSGPSFSNNKAEQIQSQQQVLNGDAMLIDSNNKEQQQKEQQKSVYIDYPNIQQVIEYEREQIDKLKEYVVQLFTVEGLKFNQQSINYQNFIQQTGNGQDISSISLQLVKEEIKLQKAQKEQSIIAKFSELGISSIFLNEKQKYINTFKPSEILQYNVLSFDQLIQKELLAQNKLKAVKDELVKIGVKVIKHDELVGTDAAKHYFNTTAEAEADENEMKSRLNAVIKYEIDYRNRKALVMQKLKQVGLIRKGVFLKHHSHTNLMDYISNQNSNFTIDQVINEQVQFWKYDKSDNACKERRTFIEDEIGDHGEIVRYNYCCEILLNSFIDKFIAGTFTCQEWESLTLESIINKQLKFTRDYLGDADSDE